MRYLWLTVVIFFCGLATSWAQSERVDYRIDHEWVRRGLIDRGFDDWLREYDRQHPPKTDLDLLAQQIGRAWLTYRRTDDRNARLEALENLLSLQLERIELYPEHPLAPIWRIRYAADLLNEQQGSRAFVHLVALELPAQHRDPFIAGLDKIETHLDQADKILSSEFHRFEELEDAELVQVNRQGLPERYQSAQFQSASLRAWCRFHRAKLCQPRSPEQVRLLYQLNEILDQLARQGSDQALGNSDLVRAIAARMLGQNAEAKTALARAVKNLPENSILFAEIERAIQALTESQPHQALEAIENIRQNHRQNVNADYRHLVDLSLNVMQGRSKLSAASAADRANRDFRNRVWAALTANLDDQPEWFPLAGAILDEGSADFPQEAAADIELVARARRAMDQEKIPLAQSTLSILLKRKTLPPALKKNVALWLARLLEDQDQFVQASAVLSELEDIQCDSADLLSESARLAWLAYRQTPTENQRSQFIKAATNLLTHFPESDQADQFKVLMADELSRNGDHRQAMEWIAKVEPGSALYLQAQATRVLILSRRIKTDPVSTQPASATSNSADVLEQACNDLILIASARQVEADRIETWTLNPQEVELVAGAILATTEALSDPAVGRSAKAKDYLTRYAPILNRRQATAQSSTIIQIQTLTHKKTPTALIEAMELADGLIDNDELLFEQTMALAVYLLNASYQLQLELPTEPTSTQEAFASRALAFALKIYELCSTAPKVSADQRDRIAAFCVIFAVYSADDATAMEMLEKLSTASDTPDLRLARARLMIVRQNYPEAIQLSMPVLQEIGPDDLRYWHGLTINLQAHLAAGSDPAQIAAAILARQHEFPELGNPVTRKALLKILKQIQSKDRQ